MAWNTMLNVIGKVFPMIAALIGIPIMINGLGMELFGILILIWVFVGYSGVLDLGLPRGLIKVLSDIHDRDDSEKMEAISTSVTLLVLFGVFVGGLLFILSDRIVTDWLNIEPSHIQDAKWSLIMIAISYPVLLTHGSYKAVLEVNQSFAVLNRLSVVYGSLNYLIPAAIVWVSPSLVSVVVVTILLRWMNVFHLATLSNRLYSGQRFSIRIRSTMLEPLIGFGKWMVLGTILATGMALADRFIIGSMISMTAIASFSTPLELLMKLDILPMSLVAVLFPAFTHATATQSNRTEPIYNMVLKLLAYTFGSICFVLILFGEWILRMWLGVEFSTQSSFVFQILCLSSYALSFVYIAQSLVQGVGRPALSVLVYVIFVVIGLPLTYFLIQNYSIEGAAIARVLRVLIEFALISIVISKVVRLSVHSQTVWVLAIGFCCLIVAFFVPFQAVWVVAATVLWGLMTIAFWTTALTSAERTSIINILPNRTSPTLKNRYDI
jgi:O-antigen/teichoic acid export membrane protein